MSRISENRIVASTGARGEGASSKWQILVLCSIDV